MFNFGLNFILDKIIKRRNLKNYILIILLIIFTIFVGGTPSVIRSCVMSSLVILSKNLYRKNNTITSFLIALDIVLILNPYNIESAGMWLSFLGTLGLVLVKFDFFEIIENLKWKNRRNFKCSVPKKRRNK